MEVLAFDPLRVGVVSWRAPEPRLTVIVKATYDIVPDGRAALSAEPDGLSGDIPLERGDADELRYASDFVPWKATPEVMIVGEVFGAVPSSMLYGRFRGAGLDKRIVAVAQLPLPRIPLSSRHLRDAATGEKGPRVGPRAWARSRWDHPEGNRIAPSGAPTEALSPAFDFAVFNAAPPDQRVASIDPGSTLRLDGLVHGKPRCGVTLSPERPVVFLASRAGATDVPLRCDTLWLDSSRAVIVLVWRGQVPATPPRDARLVVAASTKDDPDRTWAALSTRLDIAARGRAATADDAGSVWHEQSTIDIGVVATRQPTLPFADEREVDPDAVASHHPPQPRADSGTASLPSLGQSAHPADAVATRTSAGAAVPAATLPFREGSVDPELLARGASSAVDWSRGGTLALTGDGRTTLPFRAGERRSAERATPPELPMALEAYAATVVALTAPGSTEDEVLASRGGAPAAWRAAEEAIRRAIDREAGAGVGTTAVALAHALRAARESASAPPLLDALGLEGYARIAVLAGDRRGLDRELARRGLSRDAFSRATRSVRARAASDPDFAAELEAALMHARATRRGP